MTPEACAAVYGLAAREKWSQENSPLFYPRGRETIAERVERGWTITVNVQRAIKLAWLAGYKAGRRKR